MTTQMVNNTLSDINQTIFVLASTEITSCENITVSNSGKAFSVTDSSKASISDSLFRNLGIYSPIMVLEYTFKTVKLQYPTVNSIITLLLMGGLALI